jgi:hypothetical protein
MMACWWVGSAGNVLADNKDFDVSFDECVEFAGIGFVPAARARPRVPAKYTLAGDAQNAVIVVRVVDCSAVSVDGKPAKPARIAQIGLSLVVPGSSASIDNYLLWYVTDLGNLTGKFSAAGVGAGNDQQLSFEFAPSGGTGPLSIDVDAAKFPAYDLDGRASAPTADPVPFVATWWADGKHGTLRMETILPAIRFSGASMTMSFPAGSELAALSGAQTLRFALLDSYNAFDSALMQARLQ